MEYKSYSFDDTVYLGTVFGKSLNGGEVILLLGELGSGKTSFTKGISKSLEIDDVITSPSFTIMNEYYGRLFLYHFDFYRIKYKSEIEDLLEDYIYRKDGVVVIEWGEKIFNCIYRYISVKFKIFDNFRIINIERKGC